MNVASLELCKELYELSGWDLFPDGGNYWVETHFPEQRADEYIEQPIWEVRDTFWDVDETQRPYIPAYDLGYLLRKLEGFDVRLHYSNTWRRWTAWAHNDQHSQFEDTPEDAACKLAIELIKQGILTSEASERRKRP